MTGNNESVESSREAIVYVQHPEYGDFIISHDIEQLPYELGELVRRLLCEVGCAPKHG